MNMPSLMLTTASSAVSVQRPGRSGLEALALATTQSTHEWPEFRAVKRLYEPIVGRDEGTVFGDRQRKVQRIVDGTIEPGCDLERCGKQLYGRAERYRRGGGECADDVLRFARAELAAAGLLPERVAELGDQQIRREQAHAASEESGCVIASPLRHVPLHRHTRVDDQRLCARHRRRSSRMRAALSLKVRPDRLSRARTADAIRAALWPVDSLAADSRMVTSSC